MTRLKLEILVLSELCVLVGLCLLSSRVAVGVTVQTPGKPNFSGKWELITSRSSQGSATNVTLEIQHNDPEVKITRRATVKGQERVTELVYYADGRGELNMEGDERVKSSTKWDGRKLVSKGSLFWIVGGGKINVDRSYNWQLSDDDKFLVETIRVRLYPTVQGALISPNHSESKDIFMRVITQRATSQ